MRRLIPLMIGSLALGLDAFVVAGILPLVGSDLHLSTTEAGQMVTAFTLAYALLAPVFATVLAGRPLKMVLLGALVVFTIGNLLTVVATALPLLLVGRVIAGAGAGLYSPMSAAAAAGLAGPERRGRALALILGGMTTGVVIGVPAGLLLAQHAGWRSTIWLVVGLTVVAFAGIVAFLHHLEAGASAPSLRARVAVLGDRRVLSLGLITVICASTSIGSYTYLSALLGETQGATDMTPFLWVWGIGGLVASFAVGHLIDRLADTRKLVTIILVVQGLALLLMPLAGRSFVAVLPVLLVWGVAGWSAIAPQQHRMLATRSTDGPVAVSLNSSATYLGNAIGAGVGGVLLGVGLHATAIPLIFGAVAVVFAAVNLFSPASVARRDTAEQDSEQTPEPSPTTAGTESRA